MWFCTMSRSAPLALVIAGAAFQPDGLADRDLDVGDALRVPYRLEQRVAEAQRQDVLHRLLAEIMVDAERALLREDRGDRVVDLARLEARSWPSGFSSPIRTLSPASPAACRPCDRRLEQCDGAVDRKIASPPARVTDLVGQQAHRTRRGPRRIQRLIERAGRGTSAIWPGILAVGGEVGVERMRGEVAVAGVVVLRPRAAGDGQVRPGAARSAWSPNSDGSSMRWARSPVAPNSRSLATGVRVTRGLAVDRVTRSARRRDRARP